MSSGRRGLLGGMASVGLLAPLLGRRPAEAMERRPSVLLVGGAEAAPARLAREGFCFENFRADYPFRRVGWEEVLAGRWRGQGAGCRTITRVFAENGYETTLAGSCPAVAGEFESAAGLDGVVRRLAVRAGRPFFAAVVGDEGVEDLLAGLRSVGQGGDLIVVCVPPLRGGSGPFGGRPPLIVHAPARVAASARSNVAMNLLDVAPTVCGLAGLPVPDGFPGTNYAGLAATRMVAC